MKLKREASIFRLEHEMENFCRWLEAGGYRSTELASQVLHRSYSVQSWSDAATERRWRVEWHAHAGPQRVVSALQAD